MNNNTGLSSSSTSGSGSLISSLVTSINQIPIELLSDKSLFDSVIGNNDLWSMVGDYKKREILDNCLPDSLDAQEKEDTLRLLFNGQLKRFDDNPLDYIYFQLKLQRTSPDLLRTYDEVNRLKRRAYLIQEQKYQCKLLTEILTKRRILFEAAANSSPYGISPVTYQKVKSKLIPKNGNLSLRKRRKLFLRARKVKERFKLEIKNLFPDDITTDDDSDLESDVKPLRTKASHDDSINKTGPLNKAHCDINSSRDEYISTMKNFRRKRKALQNNESGDPVMDFGNITLSDIISRVANDSGDDICEKSLLASDLKSNSPFTPKSPKLLHNSTPPLTTASTTTAPVTISTSTLTSTLTSVNRKKSKSSSTSSSLSLSSPSIVTPFTLSTSLSSSVPVNRIVSLLPNLSSAPLLSRQLSLQTSTSCQTGLSSSQSLLNNFESLSPPKKSQSTTILNVNSIKREPLDIFDFDNDSPPHSFPLPPLSLSSSTTSNPVAATSFSSLPSQPHSPHISTSLPNVASIVSNSISETPITTNTLLASTIAPTVTAVATTMATVTSSTTPLLISAATQAGSTTPTTIPPTMATYVQQHSHQSKSQQLTSLPDQTILSTSKSVSETPPASFFSLIRDVFYISASNDRKLTLHKLEELVKEKLRVLDSKVNWSYEMVQSAMNYLSEVFPPPDMIPLVDYKEKNQLWQWIGVNRDSDEILIPLCNEWLEEKDKKKTTSLMDPSQPVPPAICPTNWTVRSSSEEEKKSYRDQEALRYKKPHKAFTFTIHGYTSVVGPVKGCGIGGASPHAASPNKAREHSLLVKDRPPFVTLLSLVRDAAARLPNGEGTRADICELLKDSQYLLPTVSDQQVNAIVSGALDRLHYEKDPCVKYDVNRKVWIYLHRNRSEEEFERLHEVQVAAAKAKRILNKTQRKSCSITQTPSISTTIGNFSRVNVTNFSSKQPSAKINKSALGSLTKSGESQFETNTSTILTSSSSVQSIQSIQPVQQPQPLSKPPLTSTVTLTAPTPVSVSASVSKSMPTSTTTSTFSLVSSSNQQPISFLSRSTSLKASSLQSPSSTTFNSIIPNLNLTTSSSSGITLNSTSISTLTTSSSSSTLTSNSTTTNTTTLPNINLSSSSLQRLSVGTSTLKKKATRLKPVKKESIDPGESGSVLTNITAKPISYSSGTMTIARMPATSQTLPGFEKIIPTHTTLASTSHDTFTSLISSEPGSQVKQIRPAKSLNSTMKVTSIVSSSVANVAKNLDNVQHFLSLTTKAATSLPSNITISSSATKPIAPKIGSSHSETQQIIFPSNPGQTIFGKSILNPFEPKQPVTQTIQSSSQQQQQQQAQAQSQQPQQQQIQVQSQAQQPVVASGVQHQILKPILPAPIQQIQSQFQQQQQSDKQANTTKLATTKHHQIQTQGLTQQIITLQPASIAVTTQSQQINIPKALQAQQTNKIQHIQIQIQGSSSANLSTPTQISIPTSMLFGARPGSVVLATPGGKSYMMAASGGSIVLHPQVSGANTMQTSSHVSTTGVTNTSTTSLAVRTLQGIRVIPVTTGIPVQRATGSSSLLGPNNSSQTPGVVPPHHVVARIITTNQSPHGSATQAQIVIPSTSTIQPILLASPQQLPNPSE